jgi:hypothetical protein
LGVAEWRIPVWGLGGRERAEPEEEREMQVDTAQAQTQTATSTRKRKKGKRQGIKSRHKPPSKFKNIGF